ncbi:MAG: type II secretion system F family protein [Kiritimatiellae bacterium]|nr:type II secretion system F family protein [Kiritimatiellia bacterium]
MTLLQTLAIASWALCVAGFAAYAASVAQEITYVTLADGRKTERRLPLVFRLLLPFAANFRPWLARPAFAARVAAVDRMLVSAGMEGLLSGAEFMALKFLVPIAVGGGWALLVLVLSSLLPGSFLTHLRLPLMVLGFAYGYLIPMSWLRRTLKRRHLEIMKALPFVLDLLTLSVEAGMDFMGALQRNCARRRLDPLNEELIRMMREIQVGTPRRVALRNLSARVGQSDLTAVAHALVQADELGVSIGSILRIQAEQMRDRRFDRAEKQANEAPVKMLGPLMLCIFPAVFVILLGPLVLQAARSLF